MTTRSEVICFVEDIVRFEERHLSALPPGCGNSYGYGESVGSLNTAKRILSFIKTGIDPEE